MRWLIQICGQNEAEKSFHEPARKMARWLIFVSDIHLLERHCMAQEIATDRAMHLFMRVNMCKIGESHQIFRPD